MDLNTVTEVIRQPSDGVLDWRTGDAWLAGGTWLFSEPQAQLRRLRDLAGLGWNTLASNEFGLQIGAMCTICDLYEYAKTVDCGASPLFTTSCEAFLASFKIWNSATVGGNICMSLPAGPMITLTVALDATYTVRAADGAERGVEAAEFVTGNNRNILAPGEVLRSIDIPASALRKRHAHRRFTLTKMGRSTIYMIGTQTPGSDDFALTITAGTTRPVVLSYTVIPDVAALRGAIDALPAAIWFADPNGSPDHRRHLAKHFAEEIRTELSVGDQS
ncbi:MAG: FAD binding domain-containing protein [Mycobacterium sp.]